jgi:hypothetical protein
LQPALTRRCSEEALLAPDSRLELGFIVPIPEIT